MKLRGRRCRPKSCPRQYPARLKAARKIFLIKFRLMRLFFAFFVSVNKKDKFSSFISTYGTVMKRGVLYYRTRIKDANGKLVAIYAKTPEELYNKETFALEQINLYCSR